MKHKGFSLLEVLIAILLLSFSSLSLLQYYLQLAAITHRLQAQQHELVQYGNRMETQQGFSLVELMIGLFLSSLLLGVLIHHYLIAQEQHLRTHAILNEQFDVTMVKSLMQDRLRKAGFTPCLNLHFLAIHEGNRIINPIEKKQEKDVLQIHRMDEQFAVAQAIDRFQWRLNKVLLLKKDQKVLLADCYHGEIHRVHAMHASKGEALLILQKGIEHDFIPPIYIGEWLEERFTVQKNQTGRRALFFHQDHTEELTEQIKGFSFQLIPNRQGTLVELVLQLSQKQNLTIKTRVRSL